MQLFYQPEIAKGDHFLNEEESRHAIKVLRLKSGDTIRITDGSGHFYSAEITDANPKKCSFTLTETQHIRPNGRFRHIAIAPTKNMDRLEWFVEKAVEFGVDRISPILCDHSERKVVKTERLKRKAISAIKQSIKPYLPQIDELASFREVVSLEADHKFIAYVDRENETLLKDQITKIGHHLILIGPEGDFSAEEIRLAIDQGFSKVSLGESRLRTETAGIAAAVLLNTKTSQI